ncbi:kelch repeat protein-like protein [Aaosphaeria arxii CBS 175.79]|uniref:Kelch repeat protein-like protein n=1 Tax=Aaosphaeria arxii CBS 175.79 TaxID=1450172 RepID=A0A6A5X697_9PLEO|nr:kelch repeat protein-like protein [Aaosphaeria arxii CBS 175.79]KAF2008508.1 kelch repeat protein-like protein [Aaosphaeria arxii CBS 175.79]
MEGVEASSALPPSGRRKSVFMEVGLVDEATIRRERSPAPTLNADHSPSSLRPSRFVRFQSSDNIVEEEEEVHGEDHDIDSEKDDDVQPDVVVAYPNNYGASRFYRVGILAIVLALMLPVLQTNPTSFMGVRGGVIPREQMERSSLMKREDTNTEVCKRWSHQSAIVNGTLYIYGGRSTTEAKQTSNTWGNDFLSLDLTKSWQISNPSLTGLPRPSGPPEVSNGYLWASHESLYLYGGEFSDDPQGTPTAFSTWEYKIGSKEWVEHKDPKTSAGQNAEEDGQSVQRSAEGAGFSVRALGRGWYFGGHLDFLTTEGWSIDIERIYLKGLLEYTFPGFSNNGVKSLTDGKTAGSEGVYRNITEGGLQDTAGFTERADGLLLYVPGFGDEGLLLGLTGGINDSFTQMNVIDVYDISKSQWYKQNTNGKMPNYRVNPCAVVAAAADGSSYNVYMFGGQNLQPFKNQTQYDDMWILSVPSFTWIEVDMESQSVPYARAGHSCHIWDGQMIVIGGYVGEELTCESPGIYVFNTSSLSWSDQFTALTGENALQAFNGKEDERGNPLAQQANQRGFDSKAGLEGSYGYFVPDKVQSVIGGEATGGATLTAPVQTPSEGPLKTGKPHTYTVTGPNGGIITEISDPSNRGGSDGPNVGAIVAGTIAGVFAIIAAYFAFCAWIYRKQVKIWKNHAAMIAARAEKEKTEGATAVTMSSHKDSSERTARDALFPPSSSGTSARQHPPSIADEIRLSNERTAYTGAAGVAGGGTDAIGRRSSISSSTDDLLAGQEPSFWGAKGVLLNPRRSLRVINRD